MRFNVRGEILDATSGGAERGTAWGETWSDYLRINCLLMQQPDATRD